MLVGESTGNGVRNRGRWDGLQSRTPREFAALLLPVSAAHQRNDQNDQQYQAECSATDPVHISQHWCD